MLCDLDLVVVGILLARPTASAEDVAELLALDLDVAGELLVHLEAAGAIVPVGRA